MNNGVVNMGTQIPRQDPVMNSFGYIPRSELTRLYGNSVILLSAPSSRSGDRDFVPQACWRLALLEKN